jgi:hypothetical protein
MDVLDVPHLHTHANWCPDSRLGLEHEHSFHVPKCGLIHLEATRGISFTVNRIKSVGLGGTGHRNTNCLDMTRRFNNSVSWARVAPPVGTCWTLSSKIVWTLSRCAPPVGTVAPPVGTCWTLSSKIVWTLSRCAPPVGTPQWGLAGHSPVKLSGHSPDVLLQWGQPFTDAILGGTASHLNPEWWSRLGWRAKTPYGWAGLAPAKRLPVKGGGLYIGSPDKGCHQGASSPCEFPTITVPGHPSPRRETGDQCFFLLSLQTLQTLRDCDYHQRRSPGLKSALGGGMYRRQTP